MDKQLEFELTQQEGLRKSTIEQIRELKELAKKRPLTEWERYSLDELETDLIWQDNLKDYF